MFELLKNILSLVGIFFTLYGALHFFLCIRKGKGGIDKSNVWNRLMGVTYVAMHPEVFGNIQFFKNDVGENIKLVEEAVIGRTKVDCKPVVVIKEPWLEE
jgi:hypothetical protein